MKKLLTLLLITTFAFLMLVNSFCDENVRREKMLLNGTWQTINGKNLVELPSEGWWDFQVPGREYSTGVGEPSYMWARRTIDIPLDWQDHRIFIKFNSSRFNPHIYIDGKLIAERMDGWTPFEVEITSAVKPGSTHWLQLRCQDQTATFADGFLSEQGQPYDAIRGKVLAPLGGHPMFYGPMDDVWLLSRPDIYLNDIAIVPSTRKNTLTISGIVSNPNIENLWVEGKVLDKNETALEISASPILENNWEISAAFPNAKYWSPENPHLYKLNLLLRKGKNGQIIDTVEERFGFKEFWTEGPDFYLNGVKRHLLASSTWPISQVESYDVIRRKLEDVKAANIVAFRYHVQPWPKRWVDIADEVGIMIICEAAVYTDRFGMYAYKDDRFWNNYRDHLEGMVKRDRNNASVVMWSIENELLHMGMTRFDEDLPKKLGDLGRFVKELDPYHSIMFEADLDPDGASDVIGLHYPHELPDYSDWPNTADWLDKKMETSAGGGMLGMTRHNFYWDRTKPLYIGEYLWVPQEDYSVGTIFFGDRAYTDRDTYHNKAKLQAWIDQSIAYRRAGVSGICPWSCFRHGVIVDELTRPLYEAQKDFYRPIAAFLKNRDSRFFAGDKVERTFDVFNDSVSDVNLSLKWKLADTKIKGEEKFILGPAGYKALTINFIAPHITGSKEFEFQAELFANEQQIDTIKEKYTITKRQPIDHHPADTNVILYDPEHTFYENIPSAKRINSLRNLRRINVNKSLLIIAPRIIVRENTTNTQIGESLSDAADLRAFLNRGGKVIVLEQDTLNGFGLDVLLTEKASTMTFALNEKHPILSGLSEDDLKFWRGDNYVTSYEIVRRNIYGARAVTVSGSEEGLYQSPILEIEVGKGSTLFLQALVGQKLDIEPAARKIFQNSIDYMAAQKPNENNTVVLSDDTNFTKALFDLGLKYENIRGVLNAKKLKDADILILRGGGEEIIQSQKTIAKFLKLSPLKTLYWHCPDAETFEIVMNAVGEKSLKIIPSQGPVAVNLRQNELLSGISRGDLLFTTVQKGWRREISIDPNIIDQAIIPCLQEHDNYKQKIEIENLELKGNVVSVNPGGNAAWFRAKGTASGLFSIPQSGMYLLSLIAGGKAQRETYPLIEIKINNKIIGQINLTQDEIREYSFLAELPAGQNNMEISFVNGSDWGGGIELTLDSLIIREKINIPANTELLTLPAALVKISTGKGQIIIDNIKWDKNEANINKGQQYASALFANLGASFQVQKQKDITWLDLEDFELVGERSYFGKSAKQLTFYTNATVSAEFNCVKEAEYMLLLNGYSTEAEDPQTQEDQYAIVEIKIDDKLIGGQKEINSERTSQFEIGTIRILKGEHNISVSFLNDLSADDKDRNLFLQGIGFREIPSKKRTGR